MCADICIYGSILYLVTGKEAKRPLRLTMVGCVLFDHLHVIKKRPCRFHLSCFKSYVGEG